jgi:CheY-like chemotaxis protein
MADNARYRNLAPVIELALIGSLALELFRPKTPRPTLNGIWTIVPLMLVVVCVVAGLGVLVARYWRRANCVNNDSALSIEAGCPDKPGSVDPTKTQELLPIINPRTERAPTENARLPAPIVPDPEFIRRLCADAIQQSANTLLEQFQRLLDRALDEAERLKTSTNVAEMRSEPAERIVSPVGSAQAHILLAEDDLVSQCLIEGLLKNRGFRVTSVVNGHEVLVALGLCEFDLILMDVEMPVMDGLQTTAKVRQIEQGSTGHLPIVALTANAREEDRQNCITVGMDEYLLKPVDPTSLLAVIDRLVKGGRGSLDIRRRNGVTSALETHEVFTDRRNNSIAKNETPSSPADARVPIDLLTLQGRVEGNVDLLLAMIEVFQETSPHILKRIEMAVQEGNLDEIARTSHALKGALWNMCAGPCAQSALAIEVQARTGEQGSISTLVGRFKHELDRLQAALSLTASHVKHEANSKVANRHPEGMPISRQI